VKSYVTIDTETTEPWYFENLITDKNNNDVGSALTRFQVHKYSTELLASA